MSCWARFVDFLSIREAAWGFALFRIAMGLTVLWSLYTVVSADLVPALWLTADDGGMRRLGSGSWVVRLIGQGITPEVVYALVAVAGAGALLTASGLGGRLVVAATLVAFQGVVDINGTAGGSYDELMLNALWLLLLGNSTATLSVDARLRTGQWAPAATIGAWTRYLAVYQLVLMYWTTGLQKVSAYWTPGGDFSALYYIMQQPTWQRFDMTWVAAVFPLTQLATATAWTWEVTAPLWLVAFLLTARPGGTGVWRDRLTRWRVRTVFAVLGVIFHLTIFTTMEVGPFSPASLAYYACLVHGHEWRRRRASS